LCKADAARLDLTAGTFDLPELHLILGLSILAMGVTRMLWRRFDGFPSWSDALSERDRRLVHWTERVLMLLLLLVPWAGAASDRSSAAGRGRLPIVLGGLVLSAIGMALFPWSARFGIWGVIAAIVLLYTGINVQRSPFQALLADAVPSRFRSLATGSVTFQMCVGAIVFLMLGRMLGMGPAFLIAAGTVLRKLRDLGQARPHRLAAGHRAEPRALHDRVGNLLPATFREFRLVVEEIDVRRRAVLEQVDDALGLRREVRQPREAADALAGGGRAAAE
jgi:cytochrome b561